MRRAGSATARPAGRPRSAAAGLGAGAACLLLAGCAPGEASPAQELPEGVTPASIARGDSIFHGPGFCYTCHGPDARGVPQLGTDLTDDQWHFTDGSYGSIVERILAGVSSEESGSGMPMPPRGGARLDESQVRAVAAYVWSLSRGD